MIIWRKRIIKGRGGDGGDALRILSLRIRMNILEGLYEEKDVVRKISKRVSFLSEGVGPEIGWS